MGIFKRACAFLFTTVMLLTAALFCSGGHSEALSSRGGYLINAYDCSYRVSENNTYHVVETIDVTFLEPRHGIYRYIPELNHIERRNGTKDTVYADVTVTSCSDKYDDYREADNHVIKIGDKDEEITGNHKYTITYDINWGNDVAEGEDEFYMNLIGNGWDVPIQNLTFTIEMPKTFKDTGDNIGFYYGEYKEAKIDGIRYSFDGKIIRGALIGYQIMPGASFTTRIVLEDGYFVPSRDFPLSGVIAVVLCCVCLALSFVIWFKYGRDKDVIEIVEFYPPDGLNCAETAYAYKGSLKNGDIVPMLIELAAEGYIQIEQKDEKGKNFSFRILRHYTGTDEAEKLFMDGLYQYGAVVTKKELENSFYKTLNKVNKNVVDRMKKKIFYTNSLAWRMITFPFAIVPFVIGLLGPFKVVFGDNDWVLGMLPIGGLMAVLMLITIYASHANRHIATRIVFGVIGCGVIGIFIAVFGEVFRSNNFYPNGSFLWVVFFACVVATVGQMIFFRLIERRTDYGNDLLGRIRGFRNYLMTAERPHLVSLVNQDPQYFYKILPYTYVLDITDVWVEHFESIALEPPHWYGGYTSNGFNYYTFSRFMDRTMTSMEMAMTSTPGGSSSGGGFSGGGGGGGGGGSW
ncbi:MAG: DUF2207 domain-containing protein [Eubacterium sp.]|nr:DUF2207 domain-containing protein [Eubacterium sp.]